MTRYLADGLTPISDIIGEELGYEDVIDASFDEVGRIGFFRRLSRKAKSVVRTVTKPVGTITKPIGRTIKKIPGVNDFIKLETQYANLATTGFRLAGGFATGGTKGFKHELDVTKREGMRIVQNPIVRYGTKGAALAFPALAPVAAGVEAANQVIAAIQHKDPLKAAFALETVANTAIAANGGDPDALRAIRTIKAVKDGAIPASLGKAAQGMKILGATFSIPKNATPKSVAAAAHNLLTKAKTGNVTAQSIVKQTVAAAKAGDPGAQKAAVVLAKTHAVQKRSDAFRKPAPGKRRLIKGLARKATRAVKGHSFAGAYIVDATGHVKKGNFVAK